MKNLNPSERKEFEVGELFDIHPTKAYKLTNANLLDWWEIPVVVNSSFNNGIWWFTTNQPTEKWNMITFSDTVDANTIFYQHSDFVWYPHVQWLYPVGNFKNKWNKKTLMFFSVCFKKSAFTRWFDYWNKFRRDVAIKLLIKLPASPNGEPDRNFMEEYMKMIEEKVQRSVGLLIQATQNKNKVVVWVSEWGQRLKWKKFILGDLFEIKKGTRLTRANMKEWNINYVGASALNNGITAKIGNNTNLHPANTITVCYNGSIGQSFYQTEPFWATDDVNVLYPKFELTACRAYFFTTLLCKMGKEYAFTKKRTKEIMEKDEISLPVDENNQPNYGFMDQYMTTLMNKTLLLSEKYTLS